MADAEITSANIAEGEPASKKIKSEKTVDAEEEPDLTKGDLQPTFKVEHDGEGRVKDEKKVKAEKKEEGVKGEKVKGESIKGEDGVKKEGVKTEGAKVKAEKVKGEGVKGEGVKGEGVKGENVKGEGVKGEGAKKENVKGEGVKNEGAKKEGVKAETGAKAEKGVKAEKGDSMKNEDEASKRERLKGEQFKTEAEKELMSLAKAENVKGEAKRERSRSGKKKKKDKKADKIKKEKRSRSKSGKKKKKDKDGARKRKSKWGPDTSGFSMTQIPAGKGGFLGALPGLEDAQMPQYNEEELRSRTIVLENLGRSVTGQELIEFFNGAVLAVTANAVQQAGNRSMAPVFACSVTEEDRGGDDQRKSAELRFRTEDGANVGMKLNGIEYKGHKVRTKRPEGYKPPEGVEGDPSLKVNLHEMSMARLVGAGSMRRGDEGPAPKLSIFNLPEVMTEQIVRDLLSQFGKLRMLSLIRDLSTGKIKGYGIFEYDDSRDVDLAVIALNGFVCGQNVIRVQRLGGQTTGAAGGTEKAKAQPVAATAMENSMTQRIVSNPVLAMQVKQGREVGSKPSTIVQLLNAVYQEDIMDDQDFEDITAEVHTEASRHGPVSRIVIPKPAKDGSYVDGVGKIFVAFNDLTAARKFQMDANGRKFENRIVCAAFYPQDKFLEGKYKLWSS